MNCRPSRTARIACQFGLASSTASTLTVGDIWLRLAKTFSPPHRRMASLMICGPPTVISGAFGTGKTEVSINLALALRDGGRGPVTLVDLDIVNLYFRSRQRAYALEALGTHGSAEDLMHYGEFVLSLATRVARAAREGDVMGIGGELVSEKERVFIERLDQLIQERRR